MFYSQAGQDVWVLQLTNKGFFVDVGAYDGIESSNTYALEKAGWQGLCIDPNPAAYKKLIENRKCLAINVAVGYGSNINHLGGILKIADCPHIIDYLSIDVDGGEMEVLKGMDFKKYHVRLITIEHNQYLEGTARQQQIYEYLTEQGFQRTHKDVRCLDGEWYGKIYEDWYENINDQPGG